MSSLPPRLSVFFLFGPTTFRVAQGTFSYAEYLAKLRVFTRVRAVEFPSREFPSRWRQGRPRRENRTHVSTLWNNCTLSHAVNGQPFSWLNWTSYNTHRQTHATSTLSVWRCYIHPINSRRHGILPNARMHARGCTVSSIHDKQNQLQETRGLFFSPH